MASFITLGPGTNHDYVARRYLAFLGLGPEALRFVAAPAEGAALLLRGEADYMILCSVHPGDEVVVIEPVYDSYVPAIELAGGTPVFVQMEVGPQGYSVPWDKVNPESSELTPEDEEQGWVNASYSGRDEDI